MSLWHHWKSRPEAWFKYSDLTLVEAGASPRATYLELSDMMAAYGFEGGKLIGVLVRSGINPAGLEACQPNRLAAWREHRVNDVPIDYFMVPKRRVREQVRSHSQVFGRRSAYAAFELWCAMYADGLLKGGQRYVLPTFEDAWVWMHRVMEIVKAHADM